MSFGKANKRSDKENFYEEQEDYYEEQEGLSAISIGIAWGSRVLAFSLEFALLVAFGYMIDERFGFKPWALLVCAAIGVCSFVSGIVLTAKRMERIEARAKNASGVAKTEETIK